MCTTATNWTTALTGKTFYVGLEKNGHHILFIVSQVRSLVAGWQLSGAWSLQRMVHCRRKEGYCD